MIDLFSMVLSGAISWGVGRILDTLVTCDRCGQRDPSTIGNVQVNHLGCRNCHQEVIQFTNACDFTLGPNREVGHVAAKFRGGYAVDLNPSEKGWFQPRREGWLYFYTAARAKDMLGKQFVISGAIVDYENGVVYTKRDVVYEPIYQDCQWYNPAECIALRWHDIPENCRDQRVFAIDLKVRSRYGDVLCEDRRIEQLWK